VAEETLRRTAAPTREYERLLFFTPPEARSEVEAWQPAETWIEQRGDDLGARMAAAFEAAFERGARRAVIVGSDVPALSSEHVLRSLSLLDTHDVALGPARDGGYYLLALDRPRPGLFEGVPWSTAGVLRATIDHADGQGLRVGLLEELGDLDTPDDLLREAPRLRPLLSAWPELQRLVEQAGQAGQIRRGEHDR
jgi:rSAM/selenodomain-associated transferase 1